MVQSVNLTASAVDGEDSAPASVLAPAPKGRRESVKAQPAALRFDKRLLDEV